MKHTLGMLLASMLIGLPMQAKVKTFYEPREIVPFTQLTFSQIEELAEGKQADLVIEFTPGMPMPIQLLYNFKYFSAKFNPNLTIKVEKPCYFRFMGRKVYMSEDLVTWDKPSRFMKGKIQGTARFDDNQIVINTQLVEKE
jgi:hypothetical protein